MNTFISRKKVNCNFLKTCCQYYIRRDMYGMSHLPQATLPQMQKVQFKIVALSVFIPNSSRQPLKVHLRNQNVTVA